MRSTIQAGSNQDLSVVNSIGTVSRRILLAEKDKRLRERLSQSFEKAGYETVMCRDGLDLLDHVSSYLFSLPGGHDTIDVVISDILLPGVTGLELLDGIKNVQGFPPIILIMESCMRTPVFNGKNIGAEAVFKKPFDIKELIARVDLICKDDQ